MYLPSGGQPEAAKKFILYLRCSTEMQNSDLQRLELEEYARRRGWDYEILEDRATGTTASRPMINKLMHLARTRQIDGLAVWRCDRLFRSLKDAVVTLSELTDLGVEFFSLKDAIDLTTAQGRLFANLLMSFAEFEAELTRSRVRAGLSAARARGVQLGRPVAITDEVRQQVIGLKRQGMSVRNIAKQTGIAKSSVQRIISSLSQIPFKK